MNRAKTLAFLVYLVAIPATTLRAQNVITDWNAIASTTIVKVGGKPSGAGAVWFAYAAIASYDAVNVITGGYEPFYYREKAPEGASAEAAAVAAAHRVLVKYFPSQQNQLDAQFAASITAIAASEDAKALGVQLGEASARALIAARTGDGLEAPVSYTPRRGPGAWQPTPPKFMAAATPWLGLMRPFTMTRAGQFLPKGPTPLDSEQWEADYNLTRTLGGAVSSRRTSQQTEIGRFWTEHTPQQYARAFGYLAANYHLTLPQSARLMAILWTGSADASIACFNAKYTYNFWRPVTAIEVGGGNTKLAIDSGWLPLGTTPNHPEYPAQHACFTRAVADLIAGYFGTPRVHVVVDSTVFSDGVHSHTFEDTRDLFREVFWARIYAGFHFRHSLMDGADLGTDVAKQLLGSHFRPAADRR
jgi:hypothetical protein